MEELTTMGLPLRFLFFLSLALFSTLPNHLQASFSHESHIELPSETQRSSQKQTHLHFFYHDLRSAKNPSIVQIVATPKNVPNGFGSTFVMDDPMTEGPDLSSKPVGRAQGLFGLASLNDLGMFMLINFAFTEGDYAGSSLSMLGRNPISEQNREMPIVGGTGVFRFATGYAIANSVDQISTPEHFVVEYNVTVRHG
ncbi:dirigent protein 21-like [Vigna unguiculata]|uniref:dirigent protein 21-like n=1 Tax=Vigna unguiculata TaxID=3917 RepID=UPI0010171271|nr:dirigent protein 21-like [Vigna unguiculata]